MTSRFVPYASTPGRFALQLLADLFVAAWITLWVLVAIAVHTAVSTIADFGRQVDHSAGGIARSFDSASHRADRVPLLGDALGKPLGGAAHAAQDLAGAGHSLSTTATWLAVVLAFAVAGPPTLAIAVPWLIRRVRFFRRKWTALGLAASPAGEQLLALRALTNRPLRRLVTLHPDPVGAWRREDVAAIRVLAALELRAAGIRAPHGWRRPERVTPRA